MRAWRPFSGRTRRPDPLEFSASTNFYEYANNNPVDFSDPTGTQPAPGGVGFGAGGGGGGGGGLGGFADYNNYGAGSSSDMAIQSDSPTQPLGVHGVGVGLVLGHQFSVGQSAGGVYWAQQGGGGTVLFVADTDAHFPFGGYGYVKSPHGGKAYVIPGVPKLRLRPDLNHQPPKGPHWDIGFPGNKPQYHQGIRQGNHGIEVWSHELGWILLEQALEAFIFF